jgi:uncharacterized protein (DUF362 family)
MAKVAVVRCENYDDKVFSAVKKAFNMIDAEKIIKKAKKVMIKPNVLASADPSKGITTHPSVVDAICKYLSDYDVKIFIGESSGSAAANGTRRALKKSGIEAVAKKWNVEILNFDEIKINVIDVPGAVVMKQIPIAEKIKDMDVIIDACKLKTHMLTGYTGAVKNMFGMLPGRAKVNAHVQGKDIKVFCNIILDVYLAAKPHLCILDGIVGMEGNGPASGKLKPTGIVVASTNACALDKVVGKMIGFKDGDLVYLKLAEQRGLMPEKIDVLGEKDFSIAYKKPLSYHIKMLGGISSLIFDRLQVSFRADTKKCLKCGYCMRACPEKAITMDGYPKFDKKKCIMCYCCHELCPHDAVILKKPLIVRVIDSIIKRYDD